MTSRVTPCLMRAYYRPTQGSTVVAFDEVALARFRPAALVARGLAIWQLGQFFLGEEFGFHEEDCTPCMAAMFRMGKFMGEVSYG
ncbi:hypothetical protein D3C79_851350 [compost metagenome]